MAKHGKEGDKLGDIMDDSGKDGSNTPNEKRNGDVTANGMVDDMGDVKGNKWNEEKRRDGDNETQMTTEEEIVNMDLTSQEVRNFFNIPLSPLEPPPTVTSMESGSDCRQSSQAIKKKRRLAKAKLLRSQLRRRHHHQTESKIFDIPIPDPPPKSIKLLIKYSY
uniref:Uncharacterized protein n=1 Tax=Amphimedon queenslandica TaxID=400682 RepID=A0A1X7SWL0_AMPQE